VPSTPNAPWPHNVPQRSILATHRNLVPPPPPTGTPKFPAAICLAVHMHIHTVCTTDPSEDGTVYFETSGTASHLWRPQLWGVSCYVCSSKSYANITSVQNRVIFWIPAFSDDEVNSHFSVVGTAGVLGFEARLLLHASKYNNWPRDRHMNCCHNIHALLHSLFDHSFLVHDDLLTH
jgi:hypothetical protein